VCGVGLLLGNIFAKSWRTYRLFNNKQLRTIKLREFDLLPIVVAIVGAAVVLLIVWTVIDAATDTRNTKGVDEESEFVIICNSDTHGEALFITALCYFGVLLFIALALLFMTRNSGEAFNESKRISLAVYNLTHVLILVVVCVFALGSPGDRYIMISIFVMLGVSVVVGDIFFLKTYKTLKRRRDDVAINSFGSAHRSNGRPTAPMHTTGTVGTTPSSRTTGASATSSSLANPNHIG
jgi:O-antigen/teichoic acid export membrane protein